MSAISNIKAFLLPIRSCRSTCDTGDITSPGTLKPLLKQLMAAILDPSKPELPDIEYISTGFRDLLKSGFGWVKVQRKLQFKS